jgi:plastocyanin
MTANLVRHRTMALAAATLIAAAINLHPANAAGANMIVMKNFDFAPMSLTVAAGTTVTWKNLDGEPHTVTSDTGLFRSGGLDQNDTFAFKFDKPGTYKFLCSIHPKMMGTIVVK